MDRAELFASISQAPPTPQDIVYVERRGAEYAWALVTPGDSPPESSAGAEVWMYFSGAWPEADPLRLQAFCVDMLAEMESMAGGEDRCRWPLDEPYPHAH